MMTHQEKHNLDEYASKIGHNLGPVLLEHEDDFKQQIKQKPHIQSELTRVTLLFDMMKSHVNGDYVLPVSVASYVSAGLSVVGAVTGIGMPIAPVPAVICDISILGLLYATIREEILEYVDWRTVQDPNYAKMRGLVA